MYKVARYGYKPDPKDWRDHVLTLTRVALAPKVDLRVTAKEPAIYDQGPLGSCTGNACARVHEYRQLQEAQPSPFTPSRLAIYYGERSLENTVASDAGAFIRDGMKVLATVGAAPEALWPYDPAQFSVTPPDSYFAEAANHKALAYAAVPSSLVALKSALALGNPFTLGFSVPENFESDECAKTGMLYVPTPHEPIVGGHAVVAVGYDDTMLFSTIGRRKVRGAFIVANSWGAGWGDAGYFYMPYAFVTRGLASDFWTLTTVA